MAVYYCALCRRTSFTGRRHLYSAAHRRRLRDALDRLEEEVAAARAAVDGADVRRYDPEEHERRAAEHRREAARFCRENRVEAALRERFVVAAEEYARFAAAMERAVGAYEEREEESIRQETEGKGNVHTGAKPPWLTEEDEEDGSKQQIGPSYEEFLKQMEKQKLKKLPAERVGANFDHTSQTGISLELNQGQRKRKGDQKRNTEQTKL
ncbi:UNVERIFIED_CONTAM: hypothetical protein H355_012899 [Colinus virginianus]|nr:hypothetical protein H355_012899 [Colinus virginianus]